MPGRAFSFLLLSLILLAVLTTPALLGPLVRPAATAIPETVAAPPTATPIPTPDPFGAIPIATTLGERGVETAYSLPTPTLEMLAPLGLTWEVTEEFILIDLDVPYGRDWWKQITVDPDDLGLPFTYGLSTEHMPEEEFDWSEWQTQWCSEEAY